MKNVNFSSLIAITGICLASCNDDRNEISSNRLTTTENNSFTEWNLDESVNIVSFSYNTYSLWYIYVPDGGGTFGQVVYGDCNHWQGHFNDKISSYTSTLETIRENDYNEWIYHTDKTYYIRTTVIDDFNDLKIYSANNTYLSEIKTVTKNDFNDWRVIGYMNIGDPTYGICMMPMVLTATQHY